MMPFQAYEQNQMTFLPEALDDLVPGDDLARVISGYVDSLPRSAVEAKLAKGTGRPSYHPRMMLKVVLYAYSQRLYSCRQIAKAVRQNVCFMWLAARATPDFNTINRFRSLYLAPCLPDAFAHMAQFLLGKGLIEGKDFFVDGTKLPADARKCSYVWRKNVDRYSEQVRQRAAEILAEADRVNAEEDERYGDRDLPERGGGEKLTAAQIEEAARELGEKIAAAEEKKEKKTLERSRKKLEEDAEKLRGYEEQKQTLAGRNSYSKTDPGATFMRMKDGELRAGYNLQIGTENQFVLAYSVGQNANDARGFADLMEKRETMGTQTAPQNVVADAVYGTEENYVYLEKKKMAAYLKYPAWYRQWKGKLKPFEKAAFTFDEKQNVYICPQGQVLTPDGDAEAIETQTGYQTHLTKYRCAACKDCSMGAQCTRAQDGRSIQRSEVLEAAQAAARQRLASEKGQELRRRRGTDVETPFADLKHNQGYRRVRLRGLAKATTDIGLALLSGNLRRLWKADPVWATG